jgi:TetR/AcrR family transcriptional repressor of mexJK operon
MKTAKAPNSRPRLTGERLDELLDIAAEVFIAEGFQGASTNVIAQRAGASKASLYARFATKEELFVSVLEHRMAQIFAVVAATIQTEAPMRTALFAFGTQMLQSVFSEPQIALVRVVSMEAVRFPHLGQRFFDLGPGRGLAVLSAYMKAQRHRGVLRDADPQMMAQHFLGMIANLPLLLELLGLTTHLKTQTQRTRHIEGAIDAFVRAYGSALANGVAGGG